MPGDPNHLDYTAIWTVPPALEQGPEAVHGDRGIGNESGVSKFKKASYHPEDVYQKLSDLSDGVQVQLLYLPDYGNHCTAFQAFIRRSHLQHRNYGKRVETRGNPAV